ncbi:MAG: L-serine ammonia-lyase, iron-sulfur-dependent, subunit alpha [Propionibacteriaceae bacterium]|nr:L-serine ammonia-lyase, iron-sulfur-dependent, subunit alpha [Propionibacteriaceae bacterium]
MIGPVMIGPSSSHTAASVRIGRLLRERAGGTPRHVHFRFDRHSSIAATYRAQAADLGLLAGLLGYETHSPEIVDAHALAGAAGLDYGFEVADIGPGHPNTYYAEIDGVQYRALSTGGGMVELYDCSGQALPTDQVLPVRDQTIPSVPFTTAAEIADSELPLWELALQYESARGSMAPGQVLAKMQEIVSLLERSLATNLPPDAAEGHLQRILPNQAGLLEGKTLLGGEFSRKVLYYVTRFMDIKTSMGVFAAAPTAGSAGCLPGVVFALAQRRAEAFLAAGLVGVLIAHKSTFAAEVCGCQAECGAGSGMAAAAAAQVLGCDTKTCLAAASLALQNTFGMVCDPVANRVEVPCLGKNVMAAWNAIAAANMAASGFREVIGLDETIAAMDAVGRAIPRELRCTGEGGLSTTPTALALLRRTS